MNRRREEGRGEGEGDMDLLSEPDGGRQIEHTLQWSTGNLECLLLLMGGGECTPG